MKILQFFTLLVIGLLMVMLVNIMPMSANNESNSLLIEELKENRQLWRSQQLKNYQYIYQQQCFCPLPSNVPLKVSVKNDKITQVVNLNNNQVITDLTLPKTIEELFKIIKDAIQRNADEILITYDPTLGYPTRVAIDYQKILADDEITYTVKNLSKLN
ncbi:DUF6174 domain-containing protein [Crocosphaera chwakensis]|uniref:Uncharacterized protein n=1 Tax=Crocosphaera chwakensis CCY0110 TaxID=391612 RepID=A3IUD4_9CHRO|nr:DUF6174 domain-containing protein [Crocosphaera chwakensis]EAZ89915.1 hypothetical protein CY0110_14003 [Crocosphaera chwakensis CCY0110]